MKYWTILGLFVFASSCFSQESAIDKNESAPKGVQFDVDDVSIADTLLKTVNASNAFEYKIHTKITYFPEVLKEEQFIPCSNNGLIQTVHLCYDQHRPLVLTPDAIWMAICQGVSIHINENFDDLKDQIFTSKKPDDIRIRNDDLVDGGENWADLISSFSDSTRIYVKDDYYSFFVPTFSTTTDFQRTAYQVTMLEGFSQGFKYTGDSGCGIPYITLEGKKEDWQKIHDQLNMLEGIGLDYWARSLRPVIEEFINVFEQKTNAAFWQDIYKNMSVYGATHISGWIIKLFPYIKETGEMEYNEETNLNVAKEFFKKNKFIEGDLYLMSKLSTDNFPSGISKIDINWNNFFDNTTQNMVVHAGFFAIKQYSDKSLAPSISWALCSEDAVNTDYSYWSTRTDTEHQEVYWSPYLDHEILDSAIYNVKLNTNQTAGNKDFMESVMDYCLDNNIRLEPEDFGGLILDLVILSNGTVGKITVVDGIGGVSTEKLMDVFRKLDGIWSPALVSSANMVSHLPNDKPMVKVRANSIVRIQF